MEDKFIKYIRVVVAEPGGDGTVPLTLNSEELGFSPASPLQILMRRTASVASFHFSFVVNAQ